MAVGEHTHTHTRTCTYTTARSSSDFPNQHALAFACSLKEHSLPPHLVALGEAPAADAQPVANLGGQVAGRAARPPGHILYGRVGTYGKAKTAHEAHVSQAMEPVAPVLLLHLHHKPPPVSRHVLLHPSS